MQTNYTIMKIKSTWITMATIALVSLSSCSKFDEINTNPETPEKVKSSMLATRIILNISNQSSQKSFMQPYLLTKQIVWTELVEGYQYNGLDTMEMTLTSINDAHFMGKFATSEALKSSYNGLMHFARAIKFYDLTMSLGDIPYTEALQGESDKVYFPKYNSQKDVFLGILKELDQADQLFAAGTKFEGDPLYAGDVAKWRKLINSFQLNVLIQLSKKADDTDLKIKERFASVLAGKPIFTSNSDNFQLIRSDKSGQVYPFYKVGNNFVIYPMVSDEIISPLKALKDRRLFFYANPAAAQLEKGLQPNNFDAYTGVDPSLPFENLSGIAKSKDFSKLNDRYTELVTGEPTQQYSYAHLCFVIAEAASRGWVNESAVDWYKKGIEASMSFIASNTPATSQYTHDMPMDATYIANATAQYAATFPANQEKQIEAIINQKYLASFLQARITPYYDYRRTGYPKWKINPASSLNADAPTKIPVRWRYPSVEFQNNSANLDEALKRQFNGVDDINNLIWILK